MSSLNKVILIGRLGKDPEIKQLEGGTTYAKMSIATSERYKNKDGEKIEKTEWHKVIAWRKTAEIIEKYVKKGHLICIEGKIETRSWETEGGEKRYMTEIIANSMQMLGSKGQNNQDGENRTAPPEKNSSNSEASNDNEVEQDANPEPEPEIEGEDDLPF